MLDKLLLEIDEVGETISHIIRNVDTKTSNILGQLQQLKHELELVKKEKLCPLIERIDGGILFLGGKVKKEIDIKEE